VLTRLHASSERNSLGEDLVFKAEPPSGRRSRPVAAEELGLVLRDEAQASKLSESPVVEPGLRGKRDHPGTLMRRWFDPASSRRPSRAAADERETAEQLGDSATASPADHRCLRHFRDSFETPPVAPESWVEASHILASTRSLSMASKKASAVRASEASWPVTPGSCSRPNWA
jgi:hypothetical protein